MIPVLLWGGTEIQTLSLARVLVKAGYDVTVCCYFEYDDRMISRFQSEGITIQLMHRLKTDRLYSLLKDMIRTIQSIQPDITHVQYMAPGLIPIIAARISGVRKVFATVHQPGRPYGLKAKLFLRMGSILSSVFFCISQSAEKSWFGSSRVFDPDHIEAKRNHFTLYNAVDTDAISEINRSADTMKLKTEFGLHESPVVGMVGRLRIEKGHTVLFDAMAEIIKILPSAKLLLVGDGPDRDKLRRQADRLGISGSIIWAGNKTQDEVFTLYTIMDVVAVPSLFEGFGLSAAEAMAAGCPVVASSVDGLKEVIGHGTTGYLVPPKDADALAKHLVELLSNPSKAKIMGQAGQQKITDNYSQNHYEKSIRALYRHYA